MNPRYPASLLIPLSPTSTAYGDATEIYRAEPTRRRECLYYLALGHYKMGNYDDARRFNGMLFTPPDPFSSTQTSIALQLYYWKRSQPIYKPNRYCSLSIRQSREVCTRAYFMCVKVSANSWGRGLPWNGSSYGCGGIGHTNRSRTYTASNTQIISGELVF